MTGFISELSKLLVIPQTKSWTGFCLLRVGKRDRLDFHLYFCRSKGYWAPKDTVTDSSSASSCTGETQPRLIFLINLLISSLGSSQRNRQRPGGVHGKEGSSTMSPSCQGGGSCWSFQTCLNPSLGLLGSACPAGKLPRKQTPHFPSSFFILLQFFFYTHNQASFVVCVGRKKKPNKKGISRHK